MILKEKVIWWTVGRNYKEAMQVVFVWETISTNETISEIKEFRNKDVPAYAHAHDF